MQNWLPNQIILIFHHYSFVKSFPHLVTKFTFCWQNFCEMFTFRNVLFWNHATFAELPDTDRKLASSIWLFLYLKDLLISPLSEILSLTLTCRKTTLIKIDPKSWRYKLTFHSNQVEFHEFLCKTQILHIVFHFRRSSNLIQNGVHPKNGLEKRHDHVFTRKIFSIETNSTTPGSGRTHLHSPCCQGHNCPALSPSPHLWRRRRR